MSGLDVVGKMANVTMEGKLSKVKSEKFWETVQIGGRQKIKKVPNFSWEKFKNRGRGEDFWKSKKFQVPEGTKD